MLNIPFKRILTISFLEVPSNYILAIFDEMGFKNIELSTENSEESTFT